MLNDKFLKNNAVYLVSVVFGGLLGYLFHFLISRQLSVGQYGELQAVTSITMIAGVFFSAIGYFVVKKSAVFSLHDDRGGQANFIVFARKKLEPLILGFTVIYLILMPLVKNLLHLNDYFGLLIVGFSMVVLFYSAFFNNSLQGWNDFFALSVIGVTVALIKVVSGYGLAMFSPTASSVIFSFFISAVAGWLMAKTYFQKKWIATENHRNNDEWREKYFNGISFKKSFTQIILFSLGLAVVGNLDILLIKNVASSEVAGYYGALSVLGKIILWLNFSVVSVLFPEACSFAYAGKPVNSKIIFGSYAFILLISVPAIAVYYFYSNLIVGIMFGGGYLSVAPNLWLFGLMAFSFSLLLLESKLALARYALKASAMLFLSTFILAISIFLRHDNIANIVTAVSWSFLAGWLMMLALNLKYRFFD